MLVSIAKCFNIVMHIILFENWTFEPAFMLAMWGKVKHIYRVATTFAKEEASAVGAANAGDATASFSNFFLTNLGRFR